MKINEEKTVRIEPEEAYGERNENLIVDIPKSEELKDLKVGDEIKSYTRIAKVLSIENETIKIDFNHHLAGKSLTFKIKIISIND